MSIQALNKIIPLAAQGDIFAFAQEDDWADLTKVDVSSPRIIDLVDFNKQSGGHFLPKGLLITESGLVRNKGVIDLMYKTGHAAKQSVMPGVETSGGSMSALFTADDTVVVFQNLAQDKDPKFTLLGETGSKTIELTVMTEGDLSSDGKFTAVNDGTQTDLSGVPEAVSLVITPSGDADLADSNTPAKVNIEYQTKEQVGTEMTSATGLDFADGDKTTAQTVHGPSTTSDIYKVTKISWEGWSAGTLNVKTEAKALKGILPDEIEIANNLAVNDNGALTIANNLSTIANPVQITVTATGTLVAGKTFATMRFVGVDHWDNPVDKTLTFVPKADGTFAPLTTLAFWKQINNVYGDATNWAAGATVNIRAQDKACEVEIRPQDSELEQFLTVAGNKGGIPDRHISQFITSLNIGNARNEAMMFQLETMGYRALLRTDMEGTEGVKAKEIDFSKLSPASPFVFPGWTTHVLIANQIEPYTNSSISIAQGFDYSGVQSGTPYEEVRPYRNDRRAVAIDGQVVRTKDRNLVDAYASGVVYEDVRYVMEMKLAEMFNWKTEIVLPESQIISETDVGSPAGIDRYQQQQNLGAFSNNFGKPMDWYAKIRMSNYNRVRSYA